MDISSKQLSMNTGLYMTIASFCIPCANRVPANDCEMSAVNEMYVDHSLKCMSIVIKHTIKLFHETDYTTYLGKHQLLVVLQDEPLVLGRQFHETQRWNEVVSLHSYMQGLDTLRSDHPSPPIGCLPLTLSDL